MTHPIQILTAPPSPIENDQAQPFHIRDGARIARQNAAVEATRDPRALRWVATHPKAAYTACFGYCFVSNTKAFKRVIGRGPKNAEVALFRLCEERKARQAMPQTTPPLAERLQAWKMRHRPALQATAMAELVKAAMDDLTAAQSRCTKRRLDLYEVLRCIRTASIEGQADTGSVQVASSYAYRHTWTRCTAVREGNIVRWGVERVSGGAARMAREVSVYALIGVCFDPCLPTDAWAVRHGKGVAVRYNTEGERTGVAIPMPAELQARLPFGLPGWFGRWEHGKTREACRDEIARKRAVLAVEARIARLTARDERRARLLARLSSQLTAGFEDARAVGYCEPGITAWAQARGLSLDAKVPLTVLMHDSDRRAQAVALRVAKRVIAGRVTT